MIRFVDTNILVRIMTNDVPHLAQEAFSVINQAGNNELVVTDEVVDELLFVLERAKQYNFERSVVVNLFQEVLQIAQFKFSLHVRSAFLLYAKYPKLDFVDCLLAVKGDMKRDKVLTFDKELLKVLE